jgi:hypothetical protein
MTDRIAAILAILIIVLLGYDYFAYDSEYLLFWAEKGLLALEWLAVWR